MTDLSPFEVCIEEIKKKYNLKETESKVYGPKHFVESICELAPIDEFTSYKHLKIGKISLKDANFKNITGTLSKLYIRAFQSMKSKSYLKKFIYAINEGRFSSNINLSKINKEWCDEEHQIYINCWNKISNAEGKLQLENRKKELLLGNSIFGNILKNIPAIRNSKVAQRILDKVRKHEPSMILMGRMAKSVKDDNTAELFTDVIAYYKAMVNSGDIDLASLSREAIKHAKKAGVNTTDAMSKLNQFLPLLK